MTRVAGVDAYRRGWVAVVLEASRFVDATVSPTFDAVLTRHADAIAVGVDMPIGIPDVPPRPADLAARELLGPRRSSVFLCPPRQALEAPTYGAARALVPSLTAQSFALAKRILEVEQHLDDRTIEVHPEVSFSELAGAPLRFAKKTWNGQMERRALLARAGIVLPDVLDAAGEVPVDDVLDAAAVAWTANRYAEGVAVQLPAGSRERFGTIWR